MTIIEWLAYWLQAYLAWWALLLLFLALIGALVWAFEIGEGYERNDHTDR